MAKRKRKISYKIDRVILSEVLPYEIPITFSNRLLYKFLVDNQVKFEDNNFTWKYNSEIFDEIVKLIFNLDGIIQRVDGLSFIEIGVEEPYKLSCLETIPFNFKITHKENQFRELVLIHPVNQLSIIDFYRKYKETIIYYCNISQFSIRKPVKIAKFTYFKDYTHKKNKANEPEREIIEEFGKEYENLKSFFVYERYSNIHKFYESYLYHRCEKKYNKLYKFDISKCFDSIYTHSLAWSITNKDIVKENVAINSFTFGGAFDTLMQKLNYNETNGIVIGPEFSRIFAEILLQQIDFEVQKQLENIKSIDCRFKVDYEVYRYVDDYFLFYNDEIIRDLVVQQFSNELKKYKLYISESKSGTYEKPIITELTIAKERISDLLNEIIKLKIEPIILNNAENEQDVEDNKKKKKYSIFFNSKKAIVDFKIIIKETGISYKDILNYTLAIIDRKLFSIFQKYDKACFENIEKEENFKSQFIPNLIEILDFVFFIYSVEPRVNTTIKLCVILSKTTKFIRDKRLKGKRKKYFNKDLLDFVQKKVFDEISMLLNKNKHVEHRQIESLYLLIALRDLGSNYRLDKETLIKYFGIKTNSSDELEFPYNYNYWTITVLLAYIKNAKRYDSIRYALIIHVYKLYKSINPDLIKKHAEIVYLTFDLLSCPYLYKNITDEMLDEFKNRAENKYPSEDRNLIQNHIEKLKQEKVYENKMKILTLCGNKMIKEDKIEMIKTIEKHINWFTKWTSFDFEKELNTKKSQEVY